MTSIEKLQNLLFSFSIYLFQTFRKSITETKENFGFFLFTKDILIKNQILTTDYKEGKRGFRVYPNWDVPQNKQATKTQNWQNRFFIDFSDPNFIEKFEAILKS